MPQVADALLDLAEEARTHDVTIALENEHACNVGTGEELGDILARVPHPHFAAIWDPANALVVGENPYPDGYSHVPFFRIADVHAKDCVVVDHVPTWGPAGDKAEASRICARALLDMAG